MPSPRISVLMTLYNKGPYVEEAVRSVLSSSFADFELIVMDDASTDDGPDRIRAFEDERIRLVCHAVNTGRARNANRGFDAARGDFIAILDADDAMHPERLARQLAFMEAHPRIGACGTAAQLIGERHRVVRWPDDDDTARGLLLFEDPLLYGSAMFRRSVLDEHRLRCPEDWDGPGMDYLFLLRVAGVTKVASLPDALTHYRIGPNNFRHGRDRLTDAGRIAREALRFFGIAANDPEIRAHLTLLRRIEAPTSAQEVGALNAWADRLLAFNRKACTFSPDVFEGRIHAELEHVFCLLADRDARLARLHARLSGGWSIGRLRYYLASRMRS